MTQYQFERIFSRMAKEFGKIRRGEEEEYYPILLAIEEAAIHAYWENPASNSRRMKEAIALVLYDLQSRYTSTVQDVSAFRNEDNERLEAAILMSFDPMTNQAIYENVSKEHDLTDPQALRDYYSVFVLCLLRIYDSVLTQEKRMGSNGYFDFLESVMGDAFRREVT